MMKLKRFFNSLRTITILPFVVLIIVSVGITELLSYTNSQAAIQNISAQIIDETQQRVKQNLDNRLLIPHLVNKANQEVLSQELLTLEDPNGLMRFFYQQGMRYKNEGISLGTIALGTPQGDFIGANAAENYVTVANEATERNIRRFEPDALGFPTTNMLRERPDYDATTRPWYKAALAAKGVTWNINTSATDPTRIDADAVLPYYDEQGNLICIFTTSISLGQLSDFLQQIKVGQNGQVFIVDRDGLLVASSMPEDASIAENPTVKEVGRLSVKDSTNQVVKSTASYLEQSLPIKNIQALEHISFKLDNAAYIGQVTPYSDGKGIDWLVVIVAPESDFLGQIQNNNRASFATILVAVLITIGLAFAFGQSVTNPIVSLNNAARSLANGNFSQRVNIQRNDEIGELATSFNSMAEQLAHQVETLELRVSERTSELENQASQLVSRTRELENAKSSVERRAVQLKAVSEVSKAITTFQNIDELLPRIASTISDTFGFYHVGIFMIDTAGEYAVLESSNSEGGRRMLENGHRLLVGKTGIVGNVAATGNPRVALDTGTDATFFNNPFLPETRSEMSLPLKSADKVIGVLDVQSTEQNAFSQEDVEILSLLADQVNIAIQNSRLFEEIQRTSNESQQLLKQYAREQWNRVTRGQKRVGYFYKGDFKTLDRRILSAGQDEHEQTEIQVPIMVRGQKIGTLAVRAPQGHEFTEDELDIIRAATERTAISAENARLFDETTNRAERERLVSEITNKIRSTNDPQEMLNTAMQELKQALGTSKVQILPYDPAKKAPAKDANGKSRPNS
jgi:GAF domain-containing protein/HAMP domain-containing protein